MISSFIFGILCLFLLCISDPAQARDITALQVRNQNPFVQIFGIPPTGRAVVLPQGRFEASMGMNISSHNAASRDFQEPAADEAILLDGETYRTVLELRYGLMDRLEIGGRFPYVMHRGGFLDDFVIDWHDLFGLPQGSRKTSPHDRLAFRYFRDGVFEFNLDENAQGPGDVGLFAVWQLLQSEARVPWDIALRVDLELPTGDSDHLLGSGSTDLAFSAAAARRGKTGWGDLLLFGSAGLLVMTDGDILPDQQRNFAGFGMMGVGLRPWSQVDFKLQMDAHTAIYEDTDLDPLGSPSVQLALGGTLHFSEKTTLDLAVIEDIAVETAPDVTFHLLLRRTF